MGVSFRGGGVLARPHGIAGSAAITGYGAGISHPDPLEFWKSERGLECITPRDKQWPEGEGFPQFLRGLVGNDSVLEFGCGIGRLAECFDPEQYIGVDVSRHALARARERMPSHRFMVADDDLPQAEVTLAHTVLLHVPDHALGRVVARFTSPRVIVSEILGRHWRRDGDPPVFNREAEEYVEAFSSRYMLVDRHEWPYPHYYDTNLTLLEFARC